MDCGKSGIFVVDVDVKHDGAFDRLLDLQLQFDMPDTKRVNTPSGGQHLYFRGTAQNSTSKLALGIDTRGEGGYVLIPGSSIHGRPYAFEEGSPSAADLPEALALAVGLPSPKQEIKTPPPGLELNQAANVAAFTEVMLNGDQIPEGQRNRETYIMAARGRDLGLSKEMVLSLMLAHWLSILEGAFSPAELTRTVDSVYKTAQNPIGCAAAEAMFPEDEVAGSFCAEPQAPKAPFSRSAATVIGKDIPPREWVLGTRCIKGFVDVLIATGGTSKSTLTLLECLSITSGKPLTGDPVRQSGPCFYFNAEDPDDELDRRLAACVKHFDLSKDDVSRLEVKSGYGQDFALVRESRKGGFQINTPLVEQIIAEAKSHGYVRIVFDPLVRFHRVNENDNSAMDTLMRVFSRIAAETGAAVSVMHHTNKGKKTGDDGNGDANTARGAGSVIAAARIAHTMSVMGPKEAKKAGIGEKQRPWFVRLDDAKGNLSAPSTEVKWYQRVSVEVGSEQVGVVQPVDLAYVEELKGDELALAMAVHDVLSGTDDGEMSVYEVAKEIMAAPGMYPEIEAVSDRALRRAIAELFEVEREVAGRSIRPYEKKVKKKTVLYLILDNG